jgi:hypothetical protein
MPQPVHGASVLAIIHGFAFCARTAPPLSAAAELAAQKLYFAAEAILSQDSSNPFGKWRIADTDLALMLNRLVMNGDPVPAKLGRYATRQWNSHPLRWYLDRYTIRLDRALRDWLEQERMTRYVSLEWTACPNDMAQDGFHPGPTQYRRWAELVTDRICTMREASDTSVDDDLPETVGFDSHPHASSPRFRGCCLYTNSSRFAIALAQSGYATDPSYSAKLNAIIRAHKFDQYDDRRADQ